MMAEISLQEHIFGFVFLASTYCVLFGSVKKTLWHVFILDTVHSLSSSVSVD